MLRPGHVIALCVLSLLTIGVVMVNSAGMSIEPRSAITPLSILTSRSTVYMLLALTAMALATAAPVRSTATLLAGRSHLPGSRQDRFTSVAMILGVAALLGVLALVYIPGIGREVNGSHRWLAPVPGRPDLSLQPSEIAKWGLVALVAYYGARRASVMAELRRGVLPALLAVGLVCAAVVVEDMGTAVLMGLTACVVLLAAGARWWHFLIPAPAAGLALLGALVTSPYRLQRLVTFIDPFADARGAGYHMIQSLVAVANGAVTGRGLGHGLQKFGYLPEDTTDFLFAVVCEELGVAGAAVVLALYAALAWACVSIIRRESVLVLKLLAVGVCATVGLQSLINLLVVTGLAPTKGIALPLLSSGGTGWILTAGMLGLLISIDRSRPAEATAPAPADTRHNSDDAPMGAAATA